MEVIVSTNQREVSARMRPGAMRCAKWINGFVRRSLPKLIGVLSVLVASCLIVHTYTVFGQTIDESAHIACGMEWLDHGTFFLETLHPPLARIATALLLYLSGAHDPNVSGIWAKGNAILAWNGRYSRNLTIARLGILPFFWLTCVLVWYFMSRQFDEWHAALAVLLLAFCPVVLGHSALATTDAPLMAMFLCSVLATWSLLRRPKWSTSVRAGGLIGLAILTKFTEIPFIALAAGTLFLFSWWRKGRTISWKLTALAALSSIFVIWAGYRFEYGPIMEPVSKFAAEATEVSKDKLAERAELRPLERSVVTWPGVPANDFFAGVIHGYFYGTSGRSSYLLGKVYTGGRWDFFPVAIAVKTPIALMVLFLVGIVWFMAIGEWKQNPALLLLIAGFIGPLAVGMVGQLNIGLRHILPIFPFVAMIGAVAGMRLWRLHVTGVKRLIARVMVLLLIGWNLEACFTNEPDFLAYFNEAGAIRPSYFLVDSDLDWGQDLKRLEITLRTLRVQEVSIKLLSTADLKRAGLPEFHFLEPETNPGGWIAISEFWLKEDIGYKWLESYPYLQVGRSIRLYHFATTVKHSSSLSKLSQSSSRVQKSALQSHSMIGQEEIMRRIFEGTDDDAIV